MQRSNIHTRRTRRLRESHPHRLRRFLGTFGILLALIILLAVVAYAYDLGTGKTGGISSLPGFPAFLRPANLCKTPDHSTGDSTGSLTSGGLNRTFLIHLPPSYGGKPQPLVIAYHAYSQKAETMARYSRMSTEADKANFIAVFPQGVDDPSSWNAGLGAAGPTGSADDIQFTQDLLSYLEKNYCVDSHRIYVTGYSIGGGMAYRVACRLTGEIAAIATVAGAYYHAPGGCNPSRPIPVLEIHGQADTFAPYDGNPDARMAAVSVYLNVWLNHNQCDNTSKTIFQQGDVTGVEWSHCADNSVVVHYRVSDGGHTWPGSNPNSFLGYTTHVIDADTVIWDFFSHYSR